MENSTYKFAVKSIDEAGTFEGLASVYSNVDLGGDIVAPGAFTRTLQAKGGEVPVLWAHDMRAPIGLGKLKDTAAGLSIQGRLVLSVGKAREAYDLLKAKVLRGLSIGYDVVRSDMKGSARRLLELKLYEVSLVTLPMNELAQVSAVKSDQPLSLSSIIELQGAIRNCRDGWR
jgi:HK97 family phage prohead protease